MLGKLIKHEFGYTSRICLPALAIMLGVTVFGRLFTAVLGTSFEYDGRIVIESLSMLCNVFLMVGAAWIIMILMAVRFYRNLTRDEGYLMFTLPVKPSQLIWAKLIVFSIWQYLAIVVMILAAVISFAGTTLWAEMTTQAFKDDFAYVSVLITAGLSEYMGELILLAVLFIISVILWPAAYALQLYASIATGQLLFPKNRILGAVLSYFGYSTIMQIISSLFSVPFSVSMNSILYSNDIHFVLTNYNLMLVISLLISVLFTVTFFLVTNYIFTKRLNLE